MCRAQGTGEGMFFDPETMKPAGQQRGVGRGLPRSTRRRANTGRPKSSTTISATPGHCLQAGRCAHGDRLGRRRPAVDRSRPAPRNQGQGGRRSSCPARPRCWTAPPASSVALRRPTLCPHAIDGVNHAPFAAFGGWSGAINAKADDEGQARRPTTSCPTCNQAAQSNIDVTMGWTGYNPYRISQFENVDPWVQAGFSRRSSRRITWARSVTA